ncbi:sensor domain-containing diguanylate cyclase [Bosea sp. Root483D1]|uniref:GGDEF domain-containing protein n=1 Tax=Bosea sp. Root483D1 TaxID=1736544 RepID=UPI000B23A7BD|nr:GGDEF domain-containing protein [Bosea sp. Root483D1]
MADSDARVELLWILATNTFQPEALAELQLWIEALAARVDPHSAKAICLDIALGNIQRVRGNFGEAARLLFQAYRASNTPALTLANIEAVRLLGRVWGDAGNADAALELNRAVIDFESATGNTFLLGMAHGYRGIYLNNKRRFEEALPELELARVSHRRFFAEASEAHIEREFCRARIGLKQWSMARRHCEQAQEKFVRLGEAEPEQTELLAAEVDLAEGKLDEARRRLNAVIEKGDATRGVSSFESFRLRAELNRREGEFAAAFSDLHQYIERHGRWKDAATARQTLVLSEQFTADLQAARAEALQRTLDAERAERHANTRNMIVTVVAMVLILLILFRMHYLDLRHRSRLEEIANTDALTGISNRRHILECADAQLAAAREAGRTFSVALLDLDHFKAINDTYGHQVGDSVLKRVASAATARLPANASIGRWGGEEFLIAFDGHGLEDCAAHLERLRLGVRQIWAHHDAAVMIDFSAGLADSDDPGLSVEQLIERADKALYRAKAGGRGQTCLSRLGASIVPAASRPEHVQL